MKEKKTKKYIISGIFFMSISLILLISYAISLSSNVSNSLSEDYDYVSKEIINDKTVPVIITEENKEITRPYKDEDVTIGENYYDYDGESETQEKSITYYEGTYIQNTGVDYVKKEVFNIYSIAEGKVISVTEDDINGKTIKIEHDNKLISVYQSVDEITVKENDIVNAGEKIAVSGTNKFNSSLGNHLHFELYSDNKLINPEKYFEENIGNF